MRKVYWLMCFVCWSGFVSAATLFDEGIKLFQAGHYSEAVKVFERALSAGDKSPQLRYNLGASLYKSQQYAKAQELFRQLQKEPAYRDLATYNLGQVALKRGDAVQAKRYFKQVIESSDNIKLRALAALQLKSLSPNRFAPGPSGLVELGMGTDSNVNFDPIGGTATGLHDSYTQLYATGKFWLKGDETDGYDLRLSYSNQAYSRLSSYNYGAYKLEIEKAMQTQAWLSSLGLAYDKSTYAGSAYLTTWIFDYQGKRPVSKDGRIYLTYRYSNSAADNALYAYLAGSEHQLRAAYSLYLGPSSYHTYYEYETNSLANSATRSYSASRQTLSGKYYHDLSDSWLLQMGLAYRTSSYPALGTTALRTDNRVKLDLGLNYKLTRQLHIVGEYGYTSNRSTDSLYSYDRNLVSLSGKYYF